MTGGIALVLGTVFRPGLRQRAAYWLRRARLRRVASRVRSLDRAFHFLLADRRVLLRQLAIALFANGLQLTVMVLAGIA
ncbi:MAG: hypothetical protein ACYSU0_21925, partial [Planctomycetota bacterium]